MSAKPDQHISIHAPARGATPFGRIFRLFAAISIHAPARGATTLLGFSTTLQKFQSTLPRGERRAYARRPAGNNLISIHAPARGATEGTVYSGTSTGISIHAPARGATFTALHDCINMFISIHAPARGATLLQCKLHFDLAFQSTLPRGERPYKIPAHRHSSEISIHAPARGATQSLPNAPRSCLDFNPRSREGSD